MNERTRTWKLLVISAGEETVKRIETHLRNRRHAVRAQWLDDPDGLRGQLQRQPPDLILAGDDVAALPLSTVVALRNELAPGLPAVALFSQPPAPWVATAAADTGAADWVSAAEAADLRRLEQVCLRELRAGEDRRELSQLRRHLAEQQAREQRLLEGTGDAVARVQEGVLVHANAAFAQLLGAGQASDIEGQPLMDFISADFQLRAKQLLKAAAAEKKGKASEQDFRLRTVMDGAVEQRLCITPLEGEGPATLELRARVQTTASLVTSGRLELFTRLESERRFSAVNFIRIDEFNLLEDQIGYRDAEEIVLQLAQWLRARLVPEDALFRFSTAEFAWLSRKPMDGEALKAAAETLRAGLRAQSFQSHRRETHLKVSLAIHPLGSETPPAEAMAAVVAEARKLGAQGGDRISLIGQTARDPLSAEAIRRALELGRFKLSYQPVASLEGDSRQHFDVLVRMLDPENREISGGDLFAAAEKSGLAPTLDRWVFARALRILAQREGAAEKSSLFVHLSESSVKAGDEFVAWLRQQLGTRTLQKDELVISINEKILSVQVGRAQKLARDLAGLNVSLRVNHWGASSRAEDLVEKIPLRYARFDRAFTKGLNQENTLRRMRLLLELAKQKGLKTICSNVEDANLMARLWQMGVNYIQGHRIHEPEVVLLSTDRLRERR